MGPGDHAHRATQRAAKVSSALQLGRPVPSKVDQYLRSVTLLPRRIVLPSRSPLIKHRVESASTTRSTPWGYVVNFVTVGSADDKPVELHYQDIGSGAPVVLIHGYPLDGDSWEKQTTALLEAGYRVITYDRRGFGSSTKPAGGYDYDTFAADLDGLLTQLNLTNVALVGFSMGTGEIARYLGQYGSARVSAAVFIGSLEPFLLKTEENPDGAVNRAFIEDFSRSVRKDRYAHFTGFLDDFFNTDQTLGGRLSQQALTHHWNVATTSGAEASAKAPFSWIEDFRSDIKAVDVPALIVHGTADNILPIDATARRFKEHLPSAQYVEIEDAPHGLLWTHAVEVNEALLEFLNTEFPAA